MKKRARYFLIILLMFTAPAYFSQSFVSSADQMKDYDDKQIISVETAEGRVIINSSRVRLYNSPKGIYVADSTGTKYLSHNELKSMRIKKLDAADTIILAGSIGAAAFLGILIYTFSHLKLS